MIEFTELNTGDTTDEIKSGLILTAFFLIVQPQGSSEAYYRIFKSAFLQLVGFGQRLEGWPPDSGIYCQCGIMQSENGIGITKGCKECQRFKVLVPDMMISAFGMMGIDAAWATWATVEALKLVIHRREIRNV